MKARRFHLLVTLLPQAVYAFVTIVIASGCAKAKETPTLPANTEVSAGNSDEYVVYRSEIEVYNGPDHLTYDRIATLSVGTHLTILKKTSYNDNHGNTFTYLLVRAGNIEGWIEDDDIVPAKEYDANVGKEYVVYVSELALLKEAYMNANDIESLTAGTRVICLGEVSPAETWPLFRRVRAGEQEGWVIAHYLVPAEEYDQAVREGRLDTVGEKYIVITPKLNLYANSSHNSKVLKELPYGTKLGNLSSALVQNEVDIENWIDWREVRCGNIVGWVDTDSLVPMRLVDAFRKSDELGKAGDAAGMIAAIKETQRQLIPVRRDGNESEIEKYVEEEINISPDQKRVFTGATGGSGYDDEYPLQGAYGGASVGFYFKAGEGLVKYESYGGFWAPDSVLFTCYGRKLDPYMAVSEFKLLNTDTWEEKELGNIFQDEGQGEVEFMEGYMIWLDEVRIWPTPEEGPLRSAFCFKPVLTAYEIASGKTYRLAEADLGTMDEKEDPRSSRTGYFTYYGVTMFPTGKGLPIFVKSRLYQKFKDARLLVLVSCM